MYEVTAQAALAPPSAVGDGLATSVARDDVMEALRADGPIDLVIDVTRFSDEGEPVEKRDLAVSWDRADLERLLRDTPGERIELTFDRAAIEQVFTDDVEAHGLKEKALILAVAVTAAAGGAAQASASNMAPEAGGAATGPAVSYVSPDDRAVDFSAPQQAASVSPDDRAVDFSTPQQAPSVSPDDRAVDFSTPQQAPSVSPDDRAVDFSTPQQAPSVSPDDRAVDFSTPQQAPSVSPDDRAVDFSTPTPGPSLSPDDRAVSFGTTPSTAEPTVSPDDRAVDRAWPGTEPGVTPAPDTGGGLSLEAPSPESVAIGGAIALAITAAAFAVGGRRRVTPA